jgi:hypothetical protein
MYSSILIGEHAASLAKLKAQPSSLLQLQYIREDYLKKKPAAVLFKNQLIPLANHYDKVGLSLDFSDSIFTKLEDNPLFIIGDPTEWFFQSSVEALISKNPKMIAGLVFIYPVGMSSLDSRKEIAALIHLIKVNSILTYFLRSPLDNFVNFSDIVIDPMQEVDLNSLDLLIPDLEYIVGRKLTQSTQ